MFRHFQITLNDKIRLKFDFLLQKWLPVRQKTFFGGHTNNNLVFLFCVGEISVECWKVKTFFWPCFFLSDKFVGEMFGTLVHKFFSGKC